MGTDLPPWEKGSPDRQAQQPQVPGNQSSSPQQRPGAQQQSQAQPPRPQSAYPQPPQPPAQPQTPQQPAYPQPPSYPQQQPAYPQPPAYPPANPQAPQQPYYQPAQQGYQQQGYQQQGYQQPPYSNQQYYPQQPYGQQPGFGAGSVSYMLPAGMATEAFGGFWIRLAAFVIDYFVMSVPGGVIGFIFGFTGAIAADGQGQPPEPGFGVLAILTLVWWLYFALMETRLGGTLGKLAVGLRVVDENGMYLTFGRATGRFFSRLLSSCFLAIGYIMAGFHDQKRALHDLIAGTYVVRKEFVSPTQPR